MNNTTDIVKPTNYEFEQVFSGKFQNVILRSSSVHTANVIPTQFSSLTIYKDGNLVSTKEEALAWIEKEIKDNPYRDTEFYFSDN